jgi:hypothetical protein
MEILGVTVPLPTIFTVSEDVKLKVTVVLLACPFGLVTITSLALLRSVPGGVTAVIVVGFTTTTLVGALPSIVTVAPLTKPVPVMVTGVPPSTEPEFGEIVVIVGATLSVVN